MKKAGTAPAKPARGRPGRKPGRKPAAKAAPPAAQLRAERRQSSPVDLIDRLFDLAEDAGGMGQLRRLVERLAPLERA